MANSATSATIQLDPKINQNVVAPWPASGSAPVPYRINRVPFLEPMFEGAMTYSTATPPSLKSNATPLQLPSGSMIDGTASGVEPPIYVTVGSPYGIPPIIMFSASGSPTGYSGGLLNVPVYYLVGKPTANGVTASGLANWQDPDNMWVVVNSPSGLVTVAPVAAASLIFDPSGLVGDSRSLAREATLKGGW